MQKGDDRSAFQELSLARNLLKDMIWHQLTIPLITVLIFVLQDRAETHNSTFGCQPCCGEGKSAIRVSYPFGFSDGCPIRLNCSSPEANGSAKIGEFKVLNVTQSSLLVELPAKCNRKIGSISPLFGQNYWPAWSNGFLLQQCGANHSECLIPENFVQRRFTGVSDCNNISCSSQEQNTSDLLSEGYLKGVGCEFLFSSFAAVGPDKNSFEFQALDLRWWLNGSCDPLVCSANANCINVSLTDGSVGHRCQCHDGFEGDGFPHGHGCRRAGHCNAGRYFSGHCGGRTKVAILIGGIVAGASLMTALAAICYCIRQCRNSLKSRKSVMRLISEAAGNTTVSLFTYKDIERATSGFSVKQRLGTGAYGTVYAGKLPNFEWVAIKKIRNQDTDTIDQVMNEIKLLSSVSHPNLVRLLGCCIEKGEQILVYEYMPNGTLSQHLQKERGNGLPWTIRLRIASETAHAIAYLHSAMNPPIYHRDIKSSNILLDSTYKSKVADFGLSRLGMVETELSHISTAPQGTPGYLDPQYHQNFHLSDKSDVYSFGVVLVEIITALKVVDFSRPHSEINLAALAIDRIGRGCVDEIIDPFLEPNQDAWTLSSIHKVAELAFRCLAFHRDMRPSMMEVAEELEIIRQSERVTSFTSSPYNGSDRSFGVALSMKKAAAASAGSQRLLIHQRLMDCLGSVEEAKDSSPVSVQDPWLSDHSSPSTSSLLYNVVQ
ncbi:hypothetical protein SAY87_020400 [Trapa incisa]|uniref:Protein kinase domain-containing protein n=1 Tax=Trapa incisa TaxID=236973 RepID=A0AAN7K3W6_9MYRT|nr:hypothetical protein SAY87_020400 [Trapa incisa]